MSEERRQQPDRRKPGRPGGRRATDPRPLRDQIAAIRQQEYVTIDELCLLVSCSRSTIERRMIQRPDVCERMIRDGRLIRLHRASAMRVLMQWPAQSSPSS